MYIACRHIKPNGLRCKSPALKGNPFCYYHARLHNLSNPRIGKFESIHLPVPEDAAAIQLSIAQITNGLLSGRIEPKLAGRLLYAMQVASPYAKNHPTEAPVESVDSISESFEGEDLAPELRVCKSDERCEECPHAEGCPNYHEFVEDPNDKGVVIRALIALGKHLDDPMPKGFPGFEEKAAESDDPDDDGSSPLPLLPRPRAKKAEADS